MPTLSGFYTRINRRDLIWLAVAVVFGIAIGYRFNRYAIDDPFITYRVARNIADAKGWVYNPGEKINAVTSPFSTATLAAIHRITGAGFRQIGASLTMFGLFLGAIFLGKLLNDDEIYPGGYLAGMLVMVHPKLLQSMGLETGLLVAACSAGLYFYSRGKMTLGGALFGLAVMVRMDAAILGFLALGHYLIKERKPPPLASILAPVLVVTPWFIFSYLYFGQLLPHTLSVKISQSSAGGHWGNEWMFLFALYKTIKNFLWPPDLTGLIIAVCVGTGFYWSIRNRKPWPILIFLWALLHLLAYGVVLKVPPYTWYFAPLHVMGAVVLGIGAGRAVNRLSVSLEPCGSFVIAGAACLTVWLFSATTGFIPIIGKLFNPIHLGHALGYAAIIMGGAAMCLPRLRNHAVAVTMVTIAVVASAYLPRHWNSYLNLTQIPGTQYEYYRATAKWISGNAPEVSSVGAHEIGVLGYYLPDMLIIDQCGIPTPGAAGMLAMGDMTWWIREYKPELLVLHHSAEWWEAVEGPIKNAEWFTRAYAVKAILSGKDDEGQIKVMDEDSADKLAQSQREGLFVHEVDKHAVEIWELIDEEAIPSP